MTVHRAPPHTHTHTFTPVCLASVERPVKTALLTARPRLKMLCRGDKLKTALSPAYCSLEKHCVMDKLIQTTCGEGRTPGAEEPGVGGRQPAFLSQRCRQPAFPEPPPQPASGRRWAAVPELPPPTHTHYPAGAHGVTRLGPRPPQGRTG